MKNKWFLFITVFVLFPAFLSKAEAAMENEWDSETFSTGNFSELFLKGSFKVFLIQGDAGKLEVRASDPRAFDYLNVRNENGLLKVYVDREPFDFSRVSLYLTFKTLERLEIKGGVQLRTRGFLNLENFFVRLEGGAKVDFRAKAHRFGMKTEGGVWFELAGVSDVLGLNISGAGHIDAGEMRSEHVDIRIDGVGTARVFPTATLNAQIYGMGKVKYRGNPEVTEHIEGLGAVRREE